MTSESKLIIRTATVDDVPLLLQFVRELAEYEKLLNDVVADETLLTRSLFEQRSAEAILGFADGQPVAFAFFFHNYSTFLGRRGLYLEDLFVRPEMRGRGYGKQMLVWLAALAVERGCGRFEWSVLDWNESAIAFYKNLGAQTMDEWTVFRLTGEPLAALAAQKTV